MEWDRHLADNQAFSQKNFPNFLKIIDLVRKMTQNPTDKKTQKNAKVLT